MDFAGTQLINAPRQLVWECLNDPAALQACVPGCESFTATSDDTYAAVVVAAIGPVKAKFKGTMQLLDRVAPEGYRIVGKGDGGIAGFGEMTAQVSLTDQEGGTLLSYNAGAQVGGKLAQIGSRLVGSVANKMADTFFKRFKEYVTERAAS